MALSAKLQVRQTQSLVITPQLLQAIRLLQMSGVELERFVAAEVEQNPLLDQADGEAADGREPSAPDTAGSEDADSGEGEADSLDLFPEQFGSDRGGVSAPGTHGAHFDDLGFDQTLVALESLAERLERAIEAAFARSPADRLIAQALLAALDEAGYLTVSITELSERLGAATDGVERVLRRCQALAPTGMFARSLTECLALQLAERNRLDPAMRALLDNLERLAAGDRAGLCALCGVDCEDLADMVAEIRALDPKPGVGFAHEPVRTVVPDVFVRRGAGGGWRVELNDAALPRLIVNRLYRTTVSGRLGEAEKKYLAECLQKASWLEKSLDQRARTVLGVAAEIVRRQEGFLAEGVSQLRPLNLRMVADALGIHESTVSRAAANKTIATPRGIFEFRYFFTGAIPATSGGEAHAAEAVKHRIRKLIDAEDPSAVLSDDAIVAILSRNGVEIARRTVAKYREVMGISSSVERRRDKRLLRASWSSAGSLPPPAVPV
jgi:RNA polymerase sigma-54 factor